MNTANLQLEGLYLAIAALTRALKDKNILSEAEIDAALGTAEDAVRSDRHRTEMLSDANLDAICFPIRVMRVMNGVNDGTTPSFTEVARYVGVTKPQPY